MATCAWERCGVEFTPKTSRAKYHSSVCRAQASRGRATGRGNPTVTLVLGGRAAAAEHAVGFDLTEATTAALTAAGRLDTPLGQAALVLARHADNPGTDTGSALAAVIRQLTTTLADATAGANAEGATVTSIRERIERKRNAG